MSALLEQARRTLTRMTSHSLQAGNLNFWHNDFNPEPAMTAQPGPEESDENQELFEYMLAAPHIQKQEGTEGTTLDDFVFDGDFNPDRVKRATDELAKETQESETEDQDLFAFLLSNIQSGGPYSKLWPKVRGYCRRELNRSQFNELESAYRKQPDKGPDFINTNQN